MLSTPVRDSNPWFFLTEPRWSVELAQRLRTRLPQLRVDLQQLAQRLEALRSEGLPLPSHCWHSLEPLAEALDRCSANGFHRWCSTPNAGKALAKLPPLG